MRGAYCVRKIIRIICCGSSPHAWGIRRSHHSRYSVRRFIPTCVGHTKPHQIFRGEYPVHPHMRGAYTAVQPCPVHSLRFIPTCVGLTQDKLADMVIDDGSSPLAWGIHGQSLISDGNPRSIPTCVGLTHMHRYRMLRTSVHPHLRGAHSPGVLPMTS